MRLQKITVGITGGLQKIVVGIMFCLRWGYSEIIGFTGPKNCCLDYIKITLGLQ